MKKLYTLVFALLTLAGSISLAESSCQEPQQKQQSEPLDASLYSSTPPTENLMTPSDEEEGTFSHQPPSFTSQLVRMILGLLVVIALIYAITKLGLARLGHLKLGKTEGGEIKIIAHTRLSPQHNVYLLEYAHKQRVLIATSNQGVHFLERENCANGFSSVVQNKN